MNNKNNRKQFVWGGVAVITILIVGATLMYWGKLSSWVSASLPGPSSLGACYIKANDASSPDECVIVEKNKCLTNMQALDDVEYEYWAGEGTSCDKDAILIYGDVIVESCKKRYATPEQALVDLSSACIRGVATKLDKCKEGKVYTRLYPAKMLNFSEDANSGFGPPSENPTCVAWCAEVGKCVSATPTSTPKPPTTISPTVSPR